MAVSGYGDSYKPKKVKKNRTYKEKLDARTTESSKARFKAKHPRGGNGGGNGGSRPPVDPLQQRADALTNLRYGGAETELNQRGASIAPWFQNYQNQITAAQGQAQQYAAPILQQSQDRATAAGQTAPGVDPNSEAGKQATMAAAARAALEGSFTTLLQSYGQIQNDYMAGRKTVGAAAEVGEQGRLARDRSALASDKGLYNATTVEDLRDKQHTQNLENAAYGLDVTQEANKVASDRANRRAANNEVNQYGYSKKAWAALTPDERRKIMAAVKAEGRPPKSGGAGNFSAKDRSKTQVQVRKGISRVLDKLKGKSTAPANFWSQAYDALVNELDYDPAVARAVVQIVRDGKAKPGVMGTLRRDYGVVKLPRRKPYTLPDPYVLPENAPTQSGDRPISSP